MKLNQKQKTTIISTMCLIVLSLSVVYARYCLLPKEVVEEETATVPTSTTMMTTTTTSTSKTEAPSTSSFVVTTTTTSRTTKKSNTTTTITTTTKTKKTTTKSSSYQYTGFENEMLKIVNRERLKRGLKSLKMNSNLTSIARTRAEEISKSYSSNHKRPNGSSWDTILSRLDGTSLEKWETAAENIAYGQLDVDEVMDAFIASPSHFENILSEDYDYVGFGCYCKQGVYYWTQNFVGM